MTERDFCYWLQGFIELSGNNLSGLSATQVKQISDHLNLVFNKVTPNVVQTNHPLPSLLDKKYQITC